MLVHPDGNPPPHQPVKRDRLLDVLPKLQLLAEEDHFPEIDDPPFQSVFPEDTSK